MCNIYSIYNSVCYLNNDFLNAPHISMALDCSLILIFLREGLLNNKSQRIFKRSSRYKTLNWNEHKLLTTEISFMRTWVFCEGMSTLIITFWMLCQSHECIASFTIAASVKRSCLQKEKLPLNVYKIKKYFSSFLCLVLSTVYGSLLK